MQYGHFYTLPPDIEEEINEFISISTMEFDAWPDSHKKSSHFGMDIRFTIIINTIIELDRCFKLKFSNPYVFAFRWCTSLIFKTLTIWSNRNHIFKYLRSMILILGCTDKWIRKSGFVAKTQFLFPLSMRDR